jgi:hypothetical protein
MSWCCSIEGQQAERLKVAATQRRLYAECAQAGLPTEAALNIFPAADGVQHCEIAGMRGTLGSYAEKLPKWPWLRRYIGSMNCRPVRTDRSRPVLPVLVHIGRKPFGNTAALGNSTNSPF